MSTIAESPPIGSSGPVASRLRTRVFLFLFGVLVLTGCYFLGLHRYLSWEAIRANIDVWQSWVQADLALSLIIFFVAYTLMASLSLPVCGVMSLVAGALFGRGWGTLVICIGSTIGGTAAFLMCRWMLRAWVQQRFGKRLERVNQRIERDGAFYLFTMRLVPVIPFFLLNFAMGLTPMRVRTYAWVSFFGLILPSFLYVNAGTELGAIESPLDILTTKVMVSLALLGVTPLVLRQFIGRPKCPAGTER